MKYKVTPKYYGYKYLPWSRDDMISRMVSYLCRKYTSNYCLTDKKFYDVDNAIHNLNTQHTFFIQSRSYGKEFITNCIRSAEIGYMFKSVRFYDYLQSEIMCNVRAKRFTKHVINKQLLGKQG